MSSNERIIRAGPGSSQGEPGQEKGDNDDDHQRSEQEEEENNDTKSQRRFRIVELSGCTILLAVSLVVEFSAMPLHIRAIPVQVLDLSRADETGNATTPSEPAERRYIRHLQYGEEEQEETVGTLVLALVGLVFPLLIQLWMTCRPAWNRPYDRYNTVCTYFTAVALTFLVIDITKLYCGYLRPHFYAVCDPDDRYETCTTDDDSAERGIRDSFPSGHAGLALAALGNLSLFVHHRLGVGSVPREKANSRQHQVARVWSLVAILPVLLALFLGFSRIHDDYHHPADVVGGAVIGGIIAYFCHYVWFLE